MEIGIDSFAATIPNPATGQTLPASDRMEALLAEMETADRVGLDVFGIGEHHRKEFLDSAPASRLTFQMSSAMLETEAMQRSITLLGTEVAPPVKATMGTKV